MSSKVTREEFVEGVLDVARSDNKRGYSAPNHIKSLYNLLRTLDVTLNQSTVMYEMWLTFLLAASFSLSLWCCYLSSKIPLPELVWAPPLHHWILENVSLLIDTSLVFHMVLLLKPRLELLFSDADPLNGMPFKGPLNGSSYIFPSCCFHILSQWLTTQIPGFQRSPAFPLPTLFGLASLASVWFMRLNIKSLVSQVKQAQELIGKAEKGSKEGNKTEDKKTKKKKK